MEFEYQAIKCNKFWNSIEVIKKIEIKIKDAKSTKENQYYAQDILLEAESLFSCSDYNSGNLDCVSCHSISQRYIQENKYLAKR